MSVVEQARPESERGTGVPGSPRFGPILVLWMVLTVALHGALWVAGFPSARLAEAVEQGAARVESRGIGEISDDLIRKTIATQHKSLPFWTTLAWLGDFLADPLSLAARALVLATVFSALAALVGRPVGYDLALAEASAAQGFWVLGLAVRAGLAVALRRSEVETSLALLLPAGPRPAWLWLLFRQADVFIGIGWLCLARGAWRRGQTSLVVALLVCGAFGLVEALARAGLEFVVGSGMRLDMLPR